MSHLSPLQEKNKKMIPVRASTMDCELPDMVKELAANEGLRALLKKRLFESGWKEEIKAHCREIIRDRGVENINIDDLVKEVTPKARELVPETVKREMLQRIRNILEERKTRNNNNIP
ncbi:transcription and mRNA export factor ENY2-like [Uloborus diversus]|uniref:transcription and mRNA export factor ENY2-like n=1 Tax=Uloborus diversus TaxID=327109 RepID=UPI00240A2020|nr:transcription and mRNA export factor ENY2-like [Uloborus diversus]